MRSRRCKSSKPCPARCDLRKSWKIGPPITKEKSCGSTKRLGSVIVSKPCFANFLVSVPCGEPADQMGRERSPVIRSPHGPPELPAIELSFLTVDVQTFDM